MAAYNAILTTGWARDNRFSVNRFRRQHVESSTTYASMITSCALLNLLPHGKVRLSRSVISVSIIPRGPRKPSFGPFVSHWMLCHNLQLSGPCERSRIVCLRTDVCGTDGFPRLLRQATKYSFTQRAAENSQNKVWSVFPKNQARFIILGRP